MVAKLHQHRTQYEDADDGGRYNWSQIGTTKRLIAMRHFYNYHDFIITSETTY